MATETQLKKFNADALAAFFGAGETTIASGEPQGSLADWAKIADKMTFNPRNFAREDKALMIEMTVNGKKGRIYCSQSIGTAVRAGEMTEGDLLTKQVVLTETQGGDPVLKLWDTESEGVELDLKAKAAPKVQPKSLAEMQASRLKLAEVSL